MSESPVAIYIHTPFCPSKCGYCDFNSFAMSGGIVDRTVNAMLTEIERSPWRGRPAKTIFFGGGTPTFLSSAQLTSLLQAITDCHPPIPDCEITSEANPGTVDATKFADMYAAGFNRISLGAQSFDSGDLHRLGRIHASSDIARAVGAARQAGFHNINIDLMFALPGQSMIGWKKNLQIAMELETNHLSLYCLTIEPNTRFYRHHLRGLLDLPEEDTQVEMYDLAVDACAKGGLRQYEISNFAQPGKECQHNICYWLAEEYLAYGPGAVGAYGTPRTRYTNMKHPERYCESIEMESKLWCESEELTEDMLAFERLMLGIRLTDGVSSHNLPIDQAEFKKLQDRGWLEPTADHLKLTREGQHFASEIIARIAQ
ncbi:MAG: radical SAM family heme chaperone HemW [Armatimonadetes bacterium]|nr:radical SAM family heme chaperone HemW [Armatimonadota bacterium]